MPADWFHLYDILLNEEEWLIPPIFPGLLVRVRFQRKNMPPEFGETYSWVKVTDVKGDQIYGTRYIGENVPPISEQSMPLVSD